MHVIRRLSILGGAFALATGGVMINGAGASSMHVVSTAHATGQYAVAETSGQVNKPFKIELAVSSTPSLSGLVHWTVGCVKNNKTIASKSYRETVKLPSIVKVKFRASSSSCTVAANVQISGTGKATISLESSGCAGGPLNVTHDGCQAVGATLRGSFQWRAQHPFGVDAVDAVSDTVEACGCQ
jgi:hypothetical protein